MTELKSRIHDESNGLDYVLVGDYYVPDLKLPEEQPPYRLLRVAQKGC